LMVWAAALAVALVGACNKESADISTTVSAVARTGWAEPIKKPGLPNLHKVTDNYYRGAQPTAEGMRALKKMGIKTVVNLRTFHSDRDELGDTDLAYKHIRMQAWDAEEDAVIEFLKIVTDKKNLPVFVHCLHGADRTGMITAIYRIVVCGWDKDAAIREMREGGFGFHRIWQGLPEFVAQMDVEAILRKAEIEGSAVGGVTKVKPVELEKRP